MTVEKVAQVQQWFNRMRFYLRKAVILSAKTDETQLSTDDDLFWALVKYAENVQECAVQLDNINDSIFPCLAEFPMKSENEELSWDGLKGMRSRLAHRFWDINPTVLWNTVTRDFPELDDLLGSLSMSNVMANIEDQPAAWIKAADFRKLYPAEAGDTIRPGNSIPFLYFDSIGKAQSLRIGKSNDNGLMLAHSKTGVYQTERERGPREPRMTRGR